LLLDDYGAVAMKTLSQIDKIMNTARYQKGAVYAKASEFEALGLGEKQRDKLMTALGLVKVEPITVMEEVAVAAAEPEAPAKKKRRRKGRTAPAGEAPQVAVEAETVEAAPEIAPEIAPESAPDAAATETPAEPAPPEPPVVEMRETQLIGWRQKNHEPREPRRRPQTEATGEKPARKGKPQGRPDRGGKRFDAPRNDRPQRKEPAVNPFSPFADLRARLNSKVEAEKVGQD
jgi:ATP-dependent RNA helicase SUPV3L1/SUV3